MKGFRGGRGRRPIKPETKDAHRINRHIRAREVRVVSELDGQQLGVMLIEDALKKAEEVGLDLVEVAPMAKPPVCKIMDYGKFKYREQKKQAESKKKRSEVNIKELRIRYRTDSGDLDTKLKKARDFLAEGNKVKFSMRFRGREIVYKDLGSEKFDEVAELLGDCAVVEERSPLVGRQIHIVLAPATAEQLEKRAAQKTAEAPAQPAEP